MLERKGNLYLILGCSQTQAQHLGRTVSVCPRELGKLNRKYLIYFGSWKKEHLPQQ